MRHIRLYADDHGESHFEDIIADLTLQDFAPPASPFYVSSQTDAARFLFFELPVGWGGKNTRHQSVSTLSVFQAVSK